MTFRAFIIFFCFFLSFTSCKINAVGREEAFHASSVSSVGIIGVEEENIFSKSFKESGSPFLEEGIRLILQKKKMPKRSINRFWPSFLYREEMTQKNDSTQGRLQFYQIEISDKVSFLTQLNRPVNQNFKKYLELTQKELMVTSIDIHFPRDVILKIDNALEVYLISKNPGSLSLQILKRDGTKELINFSQGVIFDYSCSAFCWTKDYRGNPVISALRHPNMACPGPLVKNPSMLDEEDIFESLR